MAVCVKASGAFAVIACCTFVSGCAHLGSLSPLASVERSVIYQPTTFPEGEWQPNLNYEDAWFESEDGVQLHGWFVPHPSPRAVALFAHGNAGNITSRAETLRLLRDRHGVSVMAFDYRGYGKSEGTPNERGILQDARAARDWLARRTGVEPHEILLMGRSLGGAVMVDLAAEDGARGLVLASTFTSLPDIAAHHYPYLPAHLMMTNRLNSLAKISKYKGPLLQTHGENDELVPIELARDLHEAALGHKRFIVIPQGGHNAPQTEEYRQVLDEFIAALE